MQLPFGHSNGLMFRAHCSVISPNYPHWLVQCETLLAGRDMRPKQGTSFKC